MIPGALPFLESLAPRELAPAAKSLVRAAITPRFAPESLVVEESIEPATLPTRDEPPRFRAPAEPPRNVTIETGESRTHNAAGRSAAGQGDTLIMEAAAAPSLVNMPLAARVAVPEAQPRVKVTREGAEAFSVSSQPAVVEGAITAQPQTVVHDATVLTISSQMRTPLREAAAAQRASPPGQHPIVHVTIDRIDVRAPAAAPRVEHTATPRRTASQSLSDYLKQHRDGQGGKGSG